MKKLFSWLPGLVLLLAVGCAPPLPDPVGHAVDVHARPWSTTLAPAVAILPARVPAGTKRKLAATSPDGRMRAFVIETPGDSGRQIEKVFLQRVPGGQLYVVEGVPLPWRPLSGLAWASDRYLVFDRTSQPHYGMHYVVDARARRLVHATPFPDKYYLDEQKKAAAAKMLVLDYYDFGPQAASWEIIGMAWWQWLTQREIDPNRDYPVKVVVYRGVTLAEVKKRCPVVRKKGQDYRYLSYDAAIKYLDATIKDMSTDELLAPVVVKLKATRALIAARLGTRAQ